jgi:hypothetical protein
MTTNANERMPATKRGWLKKLLFVLAGLVLLLIVAWFVVTSEAFFKGSLLPRIGKAMNATLTADSAALSPFSQITLRGVKLQTTGTEPLLTVVELRARYSLTAMLGGTIKVDEVLIDSPTVTVIENADGTRNTDALTQNTSQNAAATASSSPGATKPAQVDLKHFNLKNATVRYLRNHPDGTRDLLELSGVNITLDDVKNGAAGKLNFALAGKVELNPPAVEQRGGVEFKHDGNYTFTLGPDLIPTQIAGSDRTDVTQATGALADFKEAGVDMVADMTPAEIKTIAITFRKSGTTMAELRLSGLFDALKREGKLSLSTVGVDRKLLNLFGAAAGLDFGSTGITFTNVIEFTQGGSVIRTAGRLAATDLQMIQAGQPAPTRQLGANYEVTTTMKPGQAMQFAGNVAVDEISSREGTNTLRLPPVQVTFDVTQNAAVTELKQLLLKLAPTALAQNELRLAGRVDTSKPGAITGALKLTSDACDATPYYDLFTGSTASSSQPAAKPTPSPDATKEPDAMTLPLRDFKLDVDLGRVHLREIAITNLLASAQLDGGKVNVTPLSCSLNGAPIKGSLALNLGVPGFEYAFTFDAAQVPLAPLVNSYQPERKGQVAGTATATAQLKGAGITGLNLKKNLAGQFDLVATNLNLSLGDVRTPVIKSIINVVAGIPSAIRNPTAAVGNLLGGLLGARNETGGVMDEFMKSPVNAIVAHGTAGNGKLELKQAFVESIAFRGEATGAIDIAEVLTNSVMHFPVSVALGKAVSDKLGLSPANTPTNAVYVPLPEFVKMKGTLGLPKPDVNYLVVAKLALKSGGGILGNTGGAATEKVGSALGAVENLLGGKSTPASSNTNDVPTTNTPAPNPAGDLIRGLGGLLGGQKKPAATNQTPAAKP